MVDPIPNQVKVYQGKSVLRGKEGVKPGTDNFLVERPSVFHRGKILL